MNSVPLFKYLQIIFTCALIVCIVTSTVGYYISRLTWDNSIKDKNPVFDIVSFLGIREQTLKVFNFQSDYDEYLK
jgi:hypothetical protein